MKLKNQKNNKNSSTSLFVLFSLILAFVPLAMAERNEQNDDSALQTQSHQTVAQGQTQVVWPVAQIPTRQQTLAAIAPHLQPRQSLADFVPEPGDEQSTDPQMSLRLPPSNPKPQLHSDEQHVEEFETQQGIPLTNNDDYLTVKKPSHSDQNVNRFLEENNQDALLEKHRASSREDDLTQTSPENDYDPIEKPAYQTVVQTVPTEHHAKIIQLKAPTLEAQTQEPKKAETIKKPKSNETQTQATDDSAQQTDQPETTEAETQTETAVESEQPATPQTMPQITQEPASPQESTLIAPQQATDSQPPIVAPQAPQQSSTVPPATNNNANTNTITINLGPNAGAQAGQMPQGFGQFPGIYPYGLNPFFNPFVMPFYGPSPYAQQFQAMPNGQQTFAPANFQPIPTSPQSSNQTIPAPAASVVAQPPSISAQVVPVSTQSTLIPTTITTPQNPNLSTGSGVSSNRTNFIDSIRTLRAKLEQASLEKALRSDVKNFNARLDEFTTIVEMVLSRGYEPVTTLLNNPSGSVNDEIREFMELITVMVSGGRSASDQNQFRPFSTQTYDKDSAPLLNRFSNLLEYLLEGPGFVLTLFHLDLLDEFASNCKLVMFPPFLSTFANDPIDGDKAFRTSFDRAVLQTNALTNSINSGDIKVKETVPEGLLTLLDYLDKPENLTVIQPAGLKENLALGIYPKFTKENLPKDLGTFNKFAAAIIKDICRDILAAGLAKLIITGADIFIDKIESSTLFKTIKESSRLMFAAALENIYLSKIAPVTITDSKGTRKSQRLTIIDKIPEEAKKAIADKRNKSQSKNLNINSGISLRDFQILAQLRQAEDLLHVGPSEILYEASTPESKIIQNYAAGAGLLRTIFTTFNDADTFKSNTIDGVSIKLVSDETIKRLYRAINDANEDARKAVLNTLKPAYTAAHGDLMRAVRSNTTFLVRLGQIDQEARSNIEKFARP